VLAELEKLDPASAQFAQMLSEFEKSVTSHAEKEESDEFPLILSDCDESCAPRWGTLCWQQRRWHPRTHTRPLPGERRPSSRLDRSPRWLTTRATR